jgi:hypothetical protein
MRGQILLSLLLLFLAPLVGGCGSKVSEANFYRVQRGMTEEQIEDLLGPAHDVTAAPLSAERTVKTWSRGRITIRVTFLEGIVVDRSGENIPGEGIGRASGPATGVASNPG